MSAAPTVLEALSPHRQWLGEWVDMVSEDGRRLICDGERILDTGVRCFSGDAPAAT